MTPLEVLTRVRQYASDEGASEKWDDSKWLAALNEGLRWFYDYRPECRLTSTGTENAFAAVTNANSTTDMFLPDSYRVPLEDYLLGRFFRSDSGDSRDRSRDATHRGMFEAGVGQKG